MKHKSPQKDAVSTSQQDAQPRGLSAAQQQVKAKKVVCSGPSADDLLLQQEDNDLFQRFTDPMEHICFIDERSPEELTRDIQQQMAMINNAIRPCPYPNDLNVDNPLNWDFSTVPEKEQETCCWWEYVRESADIRDAIRAFHEPDKNTRKDIRVLHCGFLFNEYPVLWNSRCLVPWRSLTDNERKELVKANTQPQIGQEPVRISRNFAHLRQLYDDACKRQGEFEANWLKRGGAKYHMPPLEWLKCRNSKVTDEGTQILLLEIKWQEYCDNDIVRSFKQWVEKYRPPQFRKSRGRPSGKINAKAALRCLAIMRVLRNHTAGEVARKFKTLYLSCSGKHFRDRENAPHIFHLLLPSVRDKWPLSWRQPTKSAK